MQNIAQSLHLLYYLYYSAIQEFADLACADQWRWWVLMDGRGSSIQWSFNEEEEEDFDGSFVQLKNRRESSSTPSFVPQNILPSLYWAVSGVLQYKNIL